MIASDEEISYEYESPGVCPNYQLRGAGYGDDKRSVILDPRTIEGMEVLRRIAARADFVLANNLDDQMTRRLDQVSLATLNTAAIGIQISAFRGEKRGPLHNDMGYDPSLHERNADIGEPHKCASKVGPGICYPQNCGS